MDKIEQDLLREIKESETKNCLEYDDFAEDKWKPVFCKLCGKYFARRGIDRHLRHAHSIERFDFGIRDNKLKQHRETKEWIKQIIISMVASSSTGAMKISSTVLLNKMEGTS